MKEIIINKQSLWHVIDGPLLFIGIATATFLWFRLMDKRNWGSPFRSEKYIKVGFMILVILIVTLRRTAYIVDRIFDNTDTKTIYVSSTEGFNAGHKVYEWEDKYILSSLSIDSEYLDKHFDGHECEIEYYRLSKYISRITQIE